ncbi:MAG: response regulator [Planctomycetota bacterium]|jgi:DNA-binding response OmpR family regulator
MDKPVQVLVIEEDEHLRESIRSNLERDGFQVYTAKDTSSGIIEEACKYKPRLILLGATKELGRAVTTLKANFDTRDIPVIILTGADSIDGKKQVSETGADSYINKESVKENLAELVRLKLENCEAAIGKAQSRKRFPVLVIDDDNIVRELAKHWLYVDGFEVYTAEDGPSGIKAAREYKPNLILLDVVMPGMDGLEVLLNLKRHKKTRNIPVFMLTALNSLGNMESAFGRGADGYITKPLAGKELGKIIKTKLKKQTVPG